MVLDAASAAASAGPPAKCSTAAAACRAVGTFQKSWKVLAELTGGMVEPWLLQSQLAAKATVRRQRCSHLVHHSHSRAGVQLGGNTQARPGAPCKALRLGAVRRGQSVAQHASLGD